MEFPTTLTEFMEQFPDDNDCRRYLAISLLSRYKQAICALQLQRDPGLGNCQSA
jgi:hypothetical protein